MPLFMDVHYMAGVTAREVAETHDKDVSTQDIYGVRYLRYWVASNEGKVFCLVDAPSAKEAVAVHREVHGQEADEIYQVEEGT